ncbi:MAG TPA: GTP cyclohydrolase I FolE [Ignavibacteriaceae bacterium]|nr:GTP cyclohydrolase I FolE [Ignavibacteriaceae bacterium]
MRDPNFNCNNPGLNKNNLTLDNSPVDFRTELDDETKIELIEKNFREIMEVLGLDLEDESLKGTPRRVAKMYVKEIFSGLNPLNKPEVTVFRNNYNYKRIIIEKDITLYSTCEHHFVPITGKAHVAYIPADKVIGLSKLNRIVQFYSKKPQLQERLTEEIAREMMNILETEDVAVLIEADHLCVSSRGVNDVNSTTVTSSFNGRFNEKEISGEFLNSIKK